MYFPLSKVGLTSEFALVPSANMAECLTCFMSDQSKTGRRSVARALCTSELTIFLTEPEQTTMSS